MLKPYTSNCDEVWQERQLRYTCICIDFHVDRCLCSVVHVDCSGLSTIVIKDVIMSPLRRHIFVCFMAKSGFFGPSSVKGVGPIYCLDDICSVPRPLHTLKIWGAGVYSPRSYGAEFVVFFVLCRR